MYPPRIGLEDKRIDRVRVPCAQVPTDSSDQGEMQWVIWSSLPLLV